MPTTRISLGTRVIARADEIDSEMPGTVNSGPLFRGEMVLWKVRHEDFDNWYPTDWLRPAITLVE